MRILVFTGLGIWLLRAAGFAQTTDKALRADRVGVLSLRLPRRGKAIKTYKVALGADPVGPQQRQGDLKTPEALYLLASRNPHSQFCTSIHISNPGMRERAAARRKCVSPDGCIAVTNQEMDETWVW